jgi:division protein CdvB (Snf7/Vps24/ESCRT-III family)
MIDISDLSAIKKYIEIQNKYVNNRPMIFITEGDTITWKNSSDVFEIDAICVGEKMWSDSSAVLAVSQNKIVTDKVPKTVFGTRLSVFSVPLLDQGTAIGAFNTVTPIEHPLIAAFDIFAPIMVQMFPDGIILYTTDLEKYNQRLGSKIFDLAQNQVGDDILNDPAQEVIKTKQPSFQAIDANVYGMPIQIISFPLFDEDNEVVNTFGMVLPKQTAVDLQNMSQNLDIGLGGISAAIQQLTASASQIHDNEQALNNGIKEIINHSNEITNIAALIKEIADETKMLGLNAAIEAARAGDAGRGFGVVADEIRKLSEQTKDAVPQIAKLTDEIKKSVDHAVEMSNGSLNASQEQAAASEEITASIEEITAMAEELNEIANKL